MAPAVRTVVAPSGDNTSMPSDLIQRPLRLTRRTVLRVMGVGAASTWLPGCRNPAAPTAPRAAALPSYFTAEERIQLAALADYVLPPDDAPGGSALGAVPYIENLLTCLDYPLPEMFLGGPYSGRQPFPNADGTPSTNFPAKEFTTYRPPCRVVMQAWQLYLLGSDGVRGGGPNDAVLGKVVGLQERIRTGLKNAAALASKPLEQLSYAELNTLWIQLDGDFTDALIALVPQAAFGMPEYGGNPEGEGWAMVRYEGDILPLGFSFTDPTTGLSRDNPKWPTSIAQPGPDPQPMSDDTLDVLRQIFTALGGQEFT